MPGIAVENCKIKEVSKTRGYTGTGFPLWQTLTPSIGKVKWALIPIEFSDFKGDKNFRSRVDEQMRLLSEWFMTVSEGKFQIEWVVLDTWVTLPGVSKDYSIARSENLSYATNGPKIWKDAIAAADPVFDFTGIQTVNFILPLGQTSMLETSQGFPWDQLVKETVTQEGKISSYSIPGVFFDQPYRAYWSYWAHEFGHAIGLPHIGSSHSPNPFQAWDLMGSQDGPSRELSGWLRFFAGWLPDEKVYCQEKSKISSVDLTLVPLSNSDSGIKMGVVKLKDDRALIIESRRVTKFSCTTQRPLNGVLAYIYDATLGHGQEFLIPITPPGRSVQGSSCNTPGHVDALLHSGESFEIEGVRIEVLSQGTYDRIRISTIKP